MTTDTDKLVEMALKSGAVNHFVQGLPDRYAFSLNELAAFASAHVASLCADVKPIRAQCPECDGSGKKARLGENELGRYGWQSIPCTKCNGVGALHTYPASVVATITAQRDAAMARVAELEKDAEPDEFTRGIDAAAKMLDKMADDYSNEHAVQDSDTGVYEFGRGGKEDYYNTLRELADDILSIVYAPGEREKTAQTLKAAKDAAFEQAANLLECEYAEDAKQKRRLDQIAQHIRDLKKRSS